MTAPTYFGLAAIVFLLAFLLSIGVENAKSPDVKPGDIYGHTNKGTDPNPDAPAEPFVQIYEVLEVKDGRMKIHTQTIRKDGRVTSGISWLRTGMTEHDRKLN